MGLLTAIRGSLSLLFFGFVFLLSGVVCNAFQIAAFVIVYPFSKDLFRRINKQIVLLHWPQLISLAIWWAGVRVRFFGDEKVWNESIGKQKAIALCNHKSDIDWLLGYCIAESHSCLGGAKSMMKNSSKYLPIIGWSWWFSDYPFLKRSWVQDESRLNKLFKTLRSYTFPFWIVIFAEGTRFTSAKHAESVKFVKEHPEKNLPILDHLLLPRPKGFSHALTGLQSSVDVVYDVTFAFPKGREPTLASIGNGVQGDEVHILVRAYDPKQLPQDDAGRAQWIRDLWAEKDRLLEHHQREQIFAQPEAIRPKPLRPLVVTVVWAILLCFALGKFVHYCLAHEFYGTLGTVACVFAVLTVLVMFFVTYTVSDAQKRNMSSALLSSKKSQ